MPIKIKKQVKKALTERNKAVFAKREKRVYLAIARFIKRDIRDLIEKGVSPVNQKSANKPNTGNRSRFQKYSKSYTEAMQGKAAYWTKNGKVIRVPIDQKDKELVQFSRQLYGNKKPRPVNMKLSGKMLNSLKHRINKKSLTVYFDDKKAVYHNVDGAGKSKVLRRLLPRRGEEFSRLIQKKINETVAKEVRKLF
jgi:hypothetical protein